MDKTKTRGKHYEARIRRRGRRPTKVVRIPLRLDTQLIAICPEYLIGERCAERRACWAIQEFLNSRAQE